MIIYDKEGAKKDLESVDAREYVATGRWFYSPPELEVIVQEAEEPKKGKK